MHGTQSLSNTDAPSLRVRSYRSRWLHPCRRNANSQDESIVLVSFRIFFVDTPRIPRRVTLDRSPVVYDQGWPFLDHQGRIPEALIGRRDFAVASGDGKTDG